MKFSDDVLMAYAQGRLDQAERGELERAMRADPLLAARVARYRAQRANVGGSFGAVFDDGPQRPAQRGKVVQLDTVRAARQAFQPPPEPRRQWHWQRVAALVASLVVGALAGVFFGYRALSSPAATGLADVRDGGLVAQGMLSMALSQQLAATPAGDGQVRIGISFLTKDGGYCRSFAVGASAGLACRNGELWTIPVLAESAPGEAGSYRQAGSEMPQPVLEAVEQRIEGVALDAAAEQAARARGWRR